MRIYSRYRPSATPSPLRPRSGTPTSQASLGCAHKPTARSQRTHDRMARRPRTSQGPATGCARGRGRAGVSRGRDRVRARPRQQTGHPPTPHGGLIARTRCIIQRQPIHRSGVFRAPTGAFNASRERTPRQPAHWRRHPASADEGRVTRSRAQEERRAPPKRRADRSVDLYDGDPGTFNAGLDANLLDANGDADQQREQRQRREPTGRPDGDRRRIRPRILRCLVVRAAQQMTASENGSGLGAPRAS
jgi:hypothetical protein